MVNYFITVHERASKYRGSVLFAYVYKFLCNYKPAQSCVHVSDHRLYIDYNL